MEKKSKQKKTDKADASHHFILLQSHSKTERVVQSAEFPLSLRSPRGKKRRSSVSSNQLQKPDKGKERKGKERKGKGRKEKF